MTFTGRTVIWDHIDLHTVNPLLGYGYWNFWSSDKGQEISDAIHWHIPNAHCGYLDIYLDGGLFGLVLLGIALFSYGLRLSKRRTESYPFQVVRFALFAISIVYNLSESSYFRIGLLWFTTLLMIVSFPRKQARSATRTAPRLEAEGVAPGKQEHVAAFDQKSVPHSSFEVSAKRI